LHPVSYRRGHELDLETETAGDEMSTWKKFLIGSAAVLTLGAGATTVALAAGGNSPSGVVDISGLCDEAEHANDPRCAGVTAPTVGQNDEARGIDISGPCDQAEHANDPWCTGGVGAKDDNSGPGNGNVEERDNSGPSENSGPGNADDDEGEDNSGPAHGDDNEHEGDGSGSDGEDD
jgi:hypothetical protein